VTKIDLANEFSFLREFYELDEDKFALCLRVMIKYASFFHIIEYDSKNE